MKTALYIVLLILVVALIGGLIYYLATQVDYDAIKDSVDSAISSAADYIDSTVSSASDLLD